MSDHAAFHETILALPDDDVPRLVFADYLDEQGEHDRAEFIRVQCQLANCLPDDPDRKSLTLREAELLDVYRVEWWRQLPEFPDVHWGSYERGFVSTVRFDDASAFRDHAAAVFQAAPILHVRFSKIIAGNMAVVVDSPESEHLRHVLTLDFENENRVANGGAEILAKCRFLKNLRKLILIRNSIGPSGVRAIAESPNLRNLLELHLDYNDIFSDGALALIGDGTPRTLKKLSLGWTRIDDFSLENLLRADTLRGLTWLYISGNSLTSRGLSGIAESSALGNLEALFAERNRIGNEGAIALMNSPHVRNLCWLYLSQNRIGDDGARAILESPNLEQIQELVIEENPIGNENIRFELRKKFGDRIRM